MNAKRAFSFIEVLVSIVLLFIGLLALLKFDAFIKQDIEKSVKQHKVLMQSSGYNFSSRQGKQALSNMYEFPVLREDEKEALKDLEVHIEKLDSDDFLIYSDANFHYELQIETLRYEVNEQTILFYRVNQK